MADERILPVDEVLEEGFGGQMIPEPADRPDNWKQRYTSLTLDDMALYYGSDRYDKGQK